MEKPPQWILRNIARRPVELHQPSGQVVIIPPAGSIEVDELDQQCLAFVRRGVLSSLPVPQEAPVPDATEKTRTKSRTARRKPRTADGRQPPAPRSKKATAKRQPARKPGLPTSDEPTTRNADLSTGADE